MIELVPCKFVNLQVTHLLCDWHLHLMVLESSNPAKAQRHAESAMKGTMQLNVLQLWVVYAYSLTSNLVVRTLGLLVISRLSSFVMAVMNLNDSL